MSVLRPWRTEHVSCGCYLDSQVRRTVSVCGETPFFVVGGVVIGVRYRHEPVIGYMAIVRGHLDARGDERERG